MLPAGVAVENAMVIALHRRRRDLLDEILQPLFGDLLSRPWAATARAASRTAPTRKRATTFGDPVREVSMSKTPVIATVIAIGRIETLEGTIDCRVTSTGKCSSALTRCKRGRSRPEDGFERYTPRRTASQAVPTVAQILSRSDGFSAV